MKIAAVTAEYNPFHDGHAYHLQKTREAGATHIVAVMSGSVVQRGDFAVYDKFTRAEAAIAGGADLVIELPAAWACASAPRFASGAAQLILALGVVDAVSFGCDSGVAAAIACAAACAASPAVAEAARPLLQAGLTYPAALHRALAGLHPEAAALLSRPNNLLAAEYQKACRALGFAPEWIAVRRQGAAHDAPAAKDGTAAGDSSADGARNRAVFSEAPLIPAGAAHDAPFGGSSSDVSPASMSAAWDDAASVHGTQDSRASAQCLPHTAEPAAPRLDASSGPTGGREAPFFACARAIRRQLADGISPEQLLPNAACYRGCQLSGGIAALEQALLYRLRTADGPLPIPDRADGLADRLAAAARQATSLSELTELTRTKRYTAARVRRALLHALLGVTDKSYTPIPYLRVLAANSRGLQILSAAKGRAALPIGSSLSRLAAQSEQARQYAAFEARVSDIYALTLPRPGRCGWDQTRKFTPYD